MKPVILITCPTELELAYIFSSKLESDKFDIHYLVSGVGVPSTVFSLTKAILSLKPQFVFQLGIAGSYDNSLNLGEIVELRSDTYAGLGAIDADGRFMKLSELNLTEKTRGFQFHDELTNPQLVFNKNLRSVNALTVNSASGESKQIIQLMQNYPLAQIETMESAPVFSLCMGQIPFSCVRAISNKVEPRDRSKWQIPLALGNLSEFCHNQLPEFLETL